MDDFFRTPMGRVFFERTMPDLVKQLARLNENLEKLNQRLPTADPPSDPVPGKGQPWPTCPDAPPGRSGG